MKGPNRNLPRLPEEQYQGEVIVCVTLCVENRKSVLTQASTFEYLRGQLIQQAQVYHCLLPIYCFMPDHLHVMAMGTTEASRPKLVIDRFKLLSGQWIFRRELQWRWQERYYDHVIRADEDWKAQARYTAMNPVRAGLVENPEDYAFTGSYGFELQDILWDASN